MVEEVEAVEAVYGGGCAILQKYPPHLHIHIKPRTADIYSQQFVEAVIAIEANSKYPDEPPCITIVDSKGLDDRRQKSLITSMCNKAVELSSCLMLVALCEGAVEELSSMNHPDGDCPLCLCPLVDGEATDTSLPFMKLMSCFHCFHCECIIRWWKWLKRQNEMDHADTSATSTSQRDTESQQGREQMTDVSMGKCPVCRKLFLAKDIEHVLDLVETHSQAETNGNDLLDKDDVLQSDSEKIRKQKFEAISKLQQENNGLIEIKRHEVLVPGMFLPRPAASASTLPEKETNKKQSELPTANSKGSSNNVSSRPSSSRHRKSYSRNNPQRVQKSGHSERQWVRKEKSAGN